LINYIALATALGISVIAAIFSIIGLTAIFSGAFWPIVIMGSALEIGKVVTVSWLYQNWHYVTGFLKYYLVSAVVALLILTSMGIFGYLSKTHIEHQLTIDGVSSQNLTIINEKIRIVQKDVTDYETQIAQIDAAIDSLTKQEFAVKSLNEAEKHRKTRDLLTDKKQKRESDLSVLISEQTKLQSEVSKLEAEVGPIKYIANIVYGDADKNQLEKAVRYVIILLVFVFDPLAIVLLIAAQFGLRNHKIPKSKRRKGIIEVHKNNVRKI